MLHAGLKLGDRYRLDARIGAGGMGEVWQAVDEVLDRVVAVKAMLPEVADEPTFAQRFLVEAKAMASVNHGAVASIHDYGRSGAITYLVMEFIDGESLAQRLARVGRIEPAEVLRLVAQAADGLQAVHDRGIVHRDIKPANLLIRRDGALLITDFGISRAQDGTHLTVSGAILGTPTYISPEQVLGKPATAVSDVYSLGLTAYECLAGQRPFIGDNPYAIALQRLQSDPRTIAGDIPVAVLAVVERALAIDPAARWPSAAALADAARAAMSGHAPVPPPSRPRTRARSRRLPVLVAAAVAAVLLLVGGVTLWSSVVGSETDGTTARPAQSAIAAPNVGFVACGAAWCPTTPQCWGGLTSISGNVVPPRRIDCAAGHAWETFAAMPLPVVPSDARMDELIERDDIAAVCSAGVLAARSGDPARTKDWVREAWPMQPDAGRDRLVHCLARPESGDATGSAVRPS